jgi:hypothetical protein
MALAAALLLAAPIAAAVDAGSPGVAPPAVDAPVASAALSEREVALGRRFLLFVRVVYAPGIAVNLPANLGLPEALEEMRRTSAVRENADGSRTREFEVELMAFGLGEISITPLAVTFTARGEVGQVLTNPLALEVVGVVAEGAEEPRPDAPPVEVRRRDDQLILVGGGLVALLVVLILVIVTNRHRHHREGLPGARASRRLSPEKEALTRLASLEARGALEKDDLKPTYLEMSEILKGYIGRRFGFPAGELTTLEIRNELLARAAGAEAEPLIRPWLEEADLVKFANAAASPEEARRALYEARRFVEQTLRETSARGSR